MGENDKKESKKDVKKIIYKIFKISVMLIVGILFLWSIRLFYDIPKLVKESKQYKEFIIEKVELKDWIPYYGAALGAVLGGVITGGGLFITLRINAKELRKQREIDNARWENSNNQFNQQMKIQIINEKINDYKKCVESIDKLINNNKKLYNAIDEHYINIRIFVTKLDGIREDKRSMNELNFDEKLEKILNGIEPDPKVFDLSHMNETLGESMDSLELVKMNSKCISQQNILENIKLNAEKFDNTYDYHNFIGGFRYKNNFSIIPENYFKEEEKMYNDLKDKIAELKDNVSAYKNTIKELKPKFLLQKSYIRNEIGKLYDEKYNLDKNNNEQKLSNNN